MAPSLPALAAFGIGAWTGESTICSLRVPVFHCPAGAVFPMWSFALWVPLHTFVGLTRMLHLCAPAVQLPALFLQLFWTLK